MIDSAATLFIAWIPYAITILIYLVIFAAFIQPDAPRFFAAISFVAITLSHELFLSDYDGLRYYASAALFDLGIIILTSGIHPVPKIVLGLHKICMVSIIVNLGGWVIWFLYYPPIIYDLAFVGIYAWTLLILIKRTGLNVGGYSMDRWLSCFRFNRSPGVIRLNKNSGKI